MNVPFSLTKSFLLCFALTMILTGCSKDAIVAPASESSGEQIQLRRGPQLNYSTSLKGRNEVPPNDSKAAGHVSVKIAKDEQSIYYKITAANIENVLAAHFHMAPAGNNGPIVATLFSGGPNGPQNGVLAEGTITNDDVSGPLAGPDGLSDLIDRIRNGLIYVNVHTIAITSGELRGQL